MSPASYHQRIKAVQNPQITENDSAGFGYAELLPETINLLESVQPQPIGQHMHAEPLVDSNQNNGIERSILRSQGTFFTADGLRA